MISPDAVKSFVSWKLVAERIMIVRFKTKTRHHTIIQVYAPTKQASLNENERHFLCSLI